MGEEKSDGGGMSAVVAKGLRILRDTKAVIERSDFEIPEGSSVAIIGPNGSGKSSILHAITNLLAVEAEHFSVLGRAPDDALVDVAYVLQHLPITPGMPLTVREVVQMGRYPTLGLFRRPRHLDRERVAEAMDRLDVSELAERNIASLSGGQRQRVFVAQALAQDHRLLLLDEPLTGLDAPSARVIDDLIHREPEEGCTVIYTTHDLEEARAADYVILTAGIVVAFGTPEEVLTPAHLAKAYGLGVLHPENITPGALLDVGHENPTPPEAGIRTLAGDVS